MKSEPLCVLTIKHYYTGGGVCYASVLTASKAEKINAKRKR